MDCSNFFREFFQSLWSLLSSRVAIALYIIFLVGVVIYLIITVINDESKKVIIDTQKTNNAQPLIENLSVAQPNLPQGKKKETAQDNGERRFFMLSQIDDEMKDKKPLTGENLTLEELCDRFRKFSASKLGLFYSIEDIRKFIAGMAVSKIIIMQGMSGTGKTSLAYAFGEFLNNKSTIVPIQPMWKERTDLVGYYNEFTKKFNETTLLQKMYEANYSNNIYVTVLDEMNIARVEYYFAEFLSLLEIPNPEGRYIDVITDKWKSDPKLLKNGRLRLPVNMWYIGTANNDDSTFAISDKVYDRAMIMNLDKKTQPFTAELTRGATVTIEKWEELVAQAGKDYGITGRNARKIKALDRYMIRNFHITFGNRIMKQIRSYVPVYIACGGEELEAIDDIIYKKIMRKLETQNPVYVRKAIGKLCDEIDDIFGEDKMPLCKDYLRHLEKTI